jgi:predicted nuclease of predicted toxin-antitoxin system
VKFLIDECLSPQLARLAHARRFGESMHVNWRGLNGEADGAVLACAVERGYVLVTNNVNDFLIRIGREEVHAGLVCLDMPDERKSRALQMRLFERALEEIGEIEPLNEVLAIAVVGDEIDIDRFRWPSEAGRTGLGKPS